MWISNGIGVLASINLFLIFVLQPVIATLNGKRYWSTVEDNIFDSALGFFGSVFSAAMVVISILIYYM